MRIPGKRRLQGSVRWLRSRFVNGALILGYHRVAQVTRDPFGLCVSPEHFRQHLEALCQYAQPVRLQTVAEGLSGKGWPRRSAVLTFDDGYADLLQVKPLLADYQVPATVFVTSGSMGDTFWWDELERIIWSADPLSGQPLWHADDSAWRWAPQGMDLRVQANDWTDGRLRMLQALYRALSPLSPMEREQAMDQLRDWAGLGEKDSPISRAMTDRELMELADGDWIEVGSHSVTHSSLADLPLSEQEKEIERSKAHLEALLGRPVAAFSYPNGSCSAATRHLVRDGGYAYACASHNDVVWRHSDRFILPRFWIPDWDGTTFGQWLKRWLRT